MLGAGCTSTKPNRSPIPSPPGTPSGSATSPTSSGQAPVIFDVVTVGPSSTQDPAGEDARRLLDGMGVAVGAINRTGGVLGRPLALTVHDPLPSAAEATKVIDDLLDFGATAILYIGSGTALPPLQLKFAEKGTPVVLMQGDLYTSHQMFPQVFQTDLPWVWQANVIARYLVRDRGAKTVSLAAVGSTPSVVNATRAAVEYWGGTFSGGALGKDFPTVRHVLFRFASELGPALIVYGTPTEARNLTAYLRSSGSPVHPKWVAGPEGLLVEGSGPAVAPGTVACQTYTWSGWADPIPRVGAYADAYRAEWGEPDDLSQQGYDAIRVLVRGLRTTQGKAGQALVDAMENFRKVPFSSLPVTLTPDDHVFPGRDELGLYVRPYPDERLDPWQRPGDEVWRPLMRTFTYDGTRTVVLDEDKRVFFPFWGKNQPSPSYRRSRFGIISRPNDPWH